MFKLLHWVVMILILILSLFIGHEWGFQYGKIVYVGVIFALINTAIWFYYKSQEVPYREWWWGSKVWFEFLTICSAVCLVLLFRMITGKI